MKRLIFIPIILGLAACQTPQERIDNSYTEICISDVQYIVLNTHNISAVPHMKTDGTVHLCGDKIK